MLAARDAVVRAELRRMLDSAPGLQVVAEAGDAKTAIEAVARHAPAALVLNLGGPGDIAALDTIRAVEAACPATQVIVRARQDDARFVRHALTAGAAACLLDDLQGDDLIEAVRAAAAPDDLTEREIEVLRLLALGHTNPEIAARLQLSVRTVEAHRAHLQHKLSRPSRAELVRYALQRGLLRATEDPARG